MNNLKTECNRYSFLDLMPGLEKSFKITVTQEMQELFKQLSGDINPMHISRDYAKQSGYCDCLVYGMCTASFYSTLVGVYLPGEKCLFHECSVQWPKPVYVGDELTIYGKIAELDERYHRLKIKAYILNQREEKVSRANLIVGVRD